MNISHKTVNCNPNNIGLNYFGVNLNLSWHDGRREVEDLWDVEYISNLFENSMNIAVNKRERVIVFAIHRI